MVPREDQEKINYTQKVDFAKLRSELTALHGHELNPIKSDQERLSSEISRLGARLREEVQRAQSSVKLDLNLEKGRIREESSVHELKVKETDTRIEKEVGDLKVMLESVKFSTLQWLIGVCTVSGGAGAGARERANLAVVVGYCCTVVGCVEAVDVGAGLVWWSWRFWVLVRARVRICDIIDGGTGWAAYTLDICIIWAIYKRNHHIVSTMACTSSQRACNLLQQQNKNTIDFNKQHQNSRSILPFPTLDD